MSSGRLNLKRTPVEQAARDFRKAQKAARKAAKKRGAPSVDSISDGYDSAAGKRRRTEKHSKQPAQDYPYVFDNDGDEYGPLPPPQASSSKHKPDYDFIRTQLDAEAEEARFREKLSGAFEDDEWLDGVEACMNSYAHIPRRWRGGGMDRMDDDVSVDPQMMEDEDYAEWIREGMWRKKHAAEYAEYERKKTEHATRKAGEKAVREETAKLERDAERERTQRRRSRERKRVKEVRETYDTRWKELLLPPGIQDNRDLCFEDIPWPVLPPDLRHAKPITSEDITTEAIATFLLHSQANEFVGEVHDAEKSETQVRKEILRETMLRFHPDKFEGRILGRVRERDREKVKEIVGVVVRAVGELMAK